MSEHLPLAAYLREAADNLSKEQGPHADFDILRKVLHDIQTMYLPPIKWARRELNVKTNSAAFRYDELS